MNNNLKIENKKIFYEYVTEILKPFTKEKVILADGDETISLYDTSRMVFEINEQIDVWKNIREYFIMNGRNFDGFLNAANKYTEIPYTKYVQYCQNALPHIIIRNYWFKIVESEYPIIIVTSGLKLMWELIVQQYGWKNAIVIGGNNFNETPFIMEPALKACIVELLHQRQCTVMALGDSSIDLPMLIEADIAGVVINERNSPNLVEQLNIRKKFSSYIVDSEFDGSNSTLQRLTITELLSILNAIYPNSNE